TDWTPSKDNYDEVKTPVVNGYVADQASVPSTAVTQDNIEKTVTYTAVGKIVPVDPDGNKIPDVPTPDYKNDPDDPTKVVPNEPVPEIPGKTPETPTVTPNDPTKDTEVVYQANSQKAIINYIDQDSNYSVIKSDTVTGSSNEKINYSTATELEELLNKGYVLVSDGFPADATFDDDQNTDQVFTVIVKHGEAPVGPNNPHEPGTPVNPNDPDGPKWPATDEYSKEYTSTVHFVDENGNKVFDDNVQTSTWTRTLIIDTVTGEIKNTDASWQSDKAQYDVVNVAVKDGYYADKSQVAAKDAVQADLEDTVVYKTLGKVVPVDPNGNEIPNVSQPQYNNDPTDPTKGGKTDVPDIPGYTPEVPSVTPENPGKDTPVVYVPVQNEQTAKIIYIDTTTGATLEMDSVTGMPGTTIDYSTKDRIENLVNKGYVVVEDGFSEANDPVFDSDDNTDQVYYVRLEHATVPVGPNNPHEPGTPINPNDPDGPKWPATDEYSKEYTSTVHFVDKNGNKLREDDVQTSTWTRTLIIDKVTGEVLNSNETWLADKDSYTDVKVPVIEDYVADKAVVLGQATQQQDLETTVTYSPIGVIVPVDENGNKISGANTPQYKNDPNDPTKVVVTDTPDVPGYTTDIPSVLPNDATVDTPVVYKKVSEPVSEQSVQPAQPQLTSVTEVSQPQQASVAKSSAAPQVTKAQPETVLPQMGDSNEHNLVMLGITMLASLFGLASFTKTKKKQ
ncbi:mucin-binding protein, partial [Ligilactobacillus apodemi]|uniref:mucin-binding protein n=1 Tax=Ligilactobacillus apodemi TaxID=307126 RepID=UPI000AEC66F2